MKLFRNTFAKRGTVFTVLLVWVFALTAGWANACLLQDRGTHVHGDADSASLVVQSPRISAGHVGAIAAHDDDSDFQKAPCQKVCDEGSQSMVKAQVDFDLADAGLAPPSAIAWTAHAAARLALGSTHKLPSPTTGPPLRFRYSRLTL